MGDDKSATAPGSVKPYIKFLAVSILFLLSGLSSLIYQVIWTRMLVFVFGSTTFATSTVLAVFMGGLALGSFIAGRFADRLKNPFICYGILEGLIGIWALLAPLLFSLAIPLYKMAFEPLHLNLIAFELFRFVVASAILLLPTACMGATLPLLSRFVTENLEEVGDRVGSLYAVNTLGAVLGSLIGGFGLLPSLGLKATTLVAAATNVFLALSVFLLARFAVFGLRQISEAALIPSADANDRKAPELERRPEPKSREKMPTTVLVTLISIAISGALAMTYEVAWTRSLLMVIGSTTYAFTVMLSTFLVGIALGSYLCARFVDRLKMPIVWFGLAEMLLCLAGFFSILMFNYLPYLNVVVGSLYGKSPEISMLFRFVGAGIVLIPISLCLGFIFPLAIKVCARDRQSIGASVGQLYAMNTVGAIAGAFFSGFLVIPTLGTELTLIASSVANLLLGTVLLLAYGPIRIPIKALCGIAVLLVLVWASQAPQFWDRRMIVVAQNERRKLLFMPGQILSLAQWQEATRSYKIRFYKEGKTANVAIIEETSGVHALSTNGHIDATDAPDMENQAMLAAFPLLVNSRAKDVCVVGWGSGVTAGYGLQFPINKLVCSEIEPVVIETSPFFHKVNFRPEADKRASVEPSDGRNFLLSTAQKFDVVISEPSNPWQAGVCNLFTQDYFQIGRDSLKKGGIFTMWTQVREIPPWSLAQIFAALHAAFPCVYVMDSGVGDVNAIAFADKQKISYEQLKKSLENPKVTKELSRFGLRTAEDFIARIRVCPEGIDSATKGVIPNTDDGNRLEYDVAKTYENKLFQEQNHQWFLDHHGQIWDSIDWGAMTAEQKSAEFVAIAKACISRDLQYSLLWCKQSLILHQNADALELIADIERSQHNYAAALKTLAQGEKLYAGDERFPGLAGVISLQLGDYVRAKQLLAQALTIRSSNPIFRYYLALCYSAMDLQELTVPYVLPPSIEPEKVVELCRPPVENARFVANKPEVLLLLADAYKRLGKYDEAEQCIKRELEISPEGFRSWQVMAEIYGAQKLWQRSSYCWNRSFALAGADLPELFAQARESIRRKQYMGALMQIQRLLQRAPANKNVLAMLKDLGDHYDKAKRYYDLVLNDAAIVKPETIGLQPQRKE